MTTELRLLVASVVLGLVHLIASSHLISWQRGYRWTAGSREARLGRSPFAADNTKISVARCLILGKH